MYLLDILDNVVFFFFEEILRFKNIKNDKKINNTKFEGCSSFKIQRIN